MTTRSVASCWTRCRARGIDVSACVVDPTRSHRVDGHPHERPGPGDPHRDGRDRGDGRGRRPGLADGTGSPSPLRLLLSSRRRAVTGCRASSQSARARGITTSFDTNWDPTRQLGRRSGGDAPGVRRLLPERGRSPPDRSPGRRGGGGADARAASARPGRTDGGPIVAVKLGAAGALACRAEGPLVRVPAMPVEPLDTTGAGDSFNAGFLRAWLDGADLRECLRWGAVVRRDLDPAARRDRRSADAGRGAGGPGGIPAMTWWTDAADGRRRDVAAAGPRPREPGRRTGRHLLGLLCGAVRPPGRDDPGPAGRRHRPDRGHDATRSTSSAGTPA